MTPWLGLGAEQAEGATLACFVDGYDWTPLTFPRQRGNARVHRQRVLCWGRPHSAALGGGGEWSMPH